MDVYRVGQTERIAHLLTPPQGVTLTAADVTAVSFKLYDSTHLLVLNGSGTAVDVTNPAGVEIYYNWAPAASGNYTWDLFYTIGGETIPVHGYAQVEASGSRYDDYIPRVLRALAVTFTDEDQWDFSYASLRDALNVAVRTYSFENPRWLLASISLTSAWEYALTSLPGWVKGFSRPGRLNPRADDTAQHQRFLDPVGWDVDERRDIWRFLEYQPSAGETARVEYAVPHTLSDSADTVMGEAATAPAGLDYEAVCIYAAAHLLGETKGNRAAETDAPEQGAGLVNFGTKTERFQRQSDRLKKQARALWTRWPIGL